MEILIKIAQFILSLAILIVLHELGHFIFAKLFKTRVEKFYLFFNPGFSLFKIKKGETEYGVGWLPLGGYVKISGMIDESMDKEQLKQPPQAYEFRSKPAWQRLLMMTGGVLVNFILAFLIYIAVLYTWGEQYLPTQNVKYGVVCDSLAQSIGLRNGDKILELDHKPIEKFSDIVPEIVLNNPKTIQIERRGEKITIDIPSSFVPTLLKRSSKKFGGAPIIEPRIPFEPFEVTGFPKKSAGKTAGILEGDKLITINHEKFEYYDEYYNYLQKLKGQEVVLTLERGEELINIPLPLDKDGRLGVFIKPVQYLELSTREFTLVASIPAGINKGFEKIGSYLKQFRLIFSKEGYKSLGGFVTIGSIFPGIWDWQIFWNWTAFLSIILAIMNILPIPALDGGHVMFLLYEMVTGRKPGDKFLEYAQITGMILLFSLLILANANDIMRLFNN